MKVFVIGQNGTRLMPCNPQKARKLVESKRAVICNKMPFTIRLLYKSGQTTQPVCLGIDTGTQHIGFAVSANGEIVHKSEVELRSTMDKRSLMETRAEYRRGRRYRKVRYRKPKFKFRTKRVYSEKPVKRKSTGHMTHWTKVPNTVMSNRPEGWLPPSVRSKVDHHIRWICRYRDVLPDNTVTRIEIARFDMARMKDPDIHNELYQQGPLYDKENVKAYVLDRDGYRCILCHSKIGTKRKDGSTVKGRAHHILFKSKGATDNPEHMATVCDRCHTPEAHEPGSKLYDLMLAAKPVKRGLRDATMMNITRVRMCRAFPDAEFTYGNITKVDREHMMLPKTHANDAAAIATRGDTCRICTETLLIRQVRKKKRSLHEATPRRGRSEPNRTARRNPKNTKATGRFRLYDTVEYNGETGFITGFTGSSAYIQDFDGNYITVPGKKYKQVSLSGFRLVRHNNNWVSTART